MKKLLGLLAVFLLFNSCDDGELTVDNVDFGDAIIQSCGTNGILYKLNGNEVLILSIPQDLNPYPEVVGEKSYPITGDTQVRYRIYNGTVATDNVCATIQPGTPQVIEEWIAVGGTIVINTTVKLTTPDPKTGATKISGYNHEITFVNIIYAKPDGSTIVFEESDFGDYSKTATPPPFNFNTIDNEVDKCDTNNIVYNVAEPSLRESLNINNISEALINDQLTTKKEPIGETVNKVVYNLYSQNLSSPSLPDNPADYFCVSPTPLLPLVIQTWTAEIGDPNTQKGFIEVTTEDDGVGNYKHTIYFIGVTFSNATSGASFYYGNKILYGVLRTPK